LGLVLHQYGTRKIIEFFRILFDYIGLQRFEQRQMLLERGWNACGPKLVEEVEEHVTPIRLIS